MEEEKKPKVKKVKEKMDKSKVAKKEKKKSLDPNENDDKVEEEEQNEEVKEEEELPVKVNKNVRNIFVEDDLKSFQENFYLVEPGKNPFYLVNQ